MSNKDTFIISTKHKAKIKKLSTEEQAKLFVALLDYQDGEEVPEMELATEIVFDYMKDSIDEANENYKKTCERNSRIARSRVGKSGDDNLPQITSGDESQRVVTSGKSGEENVPPVTDNDNEYDSDNDNYKESTSKDVPKKTAGRFTPPTFKEVLEFCADNNLDIDVDRFIEYYTKRKWLGGRRKIRDWKSKAVEWSKDDKQKKKQKNKFCNFEERKIDTTLLERQLLGV